MHAFMTLFRYGDIYDIHVVSSLVLSLVDGLPTNQSELNQLSFPGCFGRACKGRRVIADNWTIGTFPTCRVSLSQATVRRNSPDEISIVFSKPLGYYPSVHLLPSEHDTGSNLRHTEDILISWFVIILALLGVASLFFCCCCMIHCKHLR